MSIIRVNIWATLICMKPWITLDGFKYYICNVIIFIVMLMIQLSVILWILNIECSLLLLNWCIYKSLGNLYFRFPCDTGRVSRDLVLILEIEIPCCNIWMKWRKKKPVLDCFWPVSRVIIVLKLLLFQLLSMRSWRANLMSNYSWLIGW